MEPRPDARALASAHRQRHRSRARAFEDIVQRVFNQVSIKAESNWTRLVYRVPPYVVGMPFYDLDLCARYAVRKLREKGFYVELYPPGVLYISWDASEID